MFVRRTDSFIASFVGGWEKRAACSRYFKSRASRHAAFVSGAVRPTTRDGIIITQERELCDFSFIEGKRDRAFPSLGRL
jgi:hypothetical protein